MSTALRSKGAFTADVSTRTRGVRIEVLLIAVRGLPGGLFSHSHRRSRAGAGAGWGPARLLPWSDVRPEARIKGSVFIRRAFFEQERELKISNWKLLILNLKKHSGRQFTKGSHKIKSARPSEMMFRALLVLALGLASCADVDSPTKPAAPKSPEDAMRGTPTTPTRPDAAESTPCARQQPRSPCASVKHPNRRDARMRISAVIVCVR